jgi:beta-lactamase regulating signal transducer with metallopeptidase domain
MTAAAAIPGIVAGLGVKATVVLALALAACLAARRRPAAFRHLILSSALIALLLLPLVGLGPVGWRSPLVPAWTSAGTATAIAGSGAAGEGAEAGRTASPADAPAPPEGSRLAPRPGGSVAALSVGDGDRGLLAGPGPARARSGRSRDGRLDVSDPGRMRAAVLGRLAAAAWAAGFLALLLRLAMGLAGAIRLTAQGTPLEGRPWRALVERFLTLVSLRRPVRLRSHPLVSVPLTWGWRRPVVLFPEGADDWSEDERSSALFHELSHIKRADFLVMLLVRTSLAAFWWNPLCWIVYREMRKEQEIACDELVLRAGIRPSTYAASLLAFRRSSGLRWNPSAAWLGLLGRTSFQDRLAAILRQRMTFMEVKMRTKIMMALALVAAVGLIGTARPAAGRDATGSAAAAVMTETSLPAPGPMGSALTAPGAAAANEPAAVQEKAREQEKSKAQEKAKEAEKAEKEKAAGKPIVVVGRDSASSPIVITVTEGDQVRTLTLDHAVTIAKGKDGEELVLTTEGQEPIVLKGEPLRLEVKGGRLEVLAGRRAAEPGEAEKIEVLREGEKFGQTLVFRTREPGLAFTLAKPEQEKSGATIIICGPEGNEKAERKMRIAREKGAEEAPGEVITRRIEEIKPGQKWVSAETGKEGQEAKEGGAWSVVEGSKGRAVWVTEGRARKALAFTSETDKEMLEKIRELQKQVEAIKAKKMDLAALEESLKKLEAELQAKDKELEGLTVKMEREPIELEVVREADKVKDEDKGVVVYVVKDKAEGRSAGRAETSVKVTSPDKGAITLVFGRKGLTREDYDRATAGLKKALPEGYKLSGSEFEEEAGSMHFTVTPPEGKPADKALIKKLVESLEASVAKK